MRIECPTCQATYKVGDDKVVGRLVKIRCKQCSAVIAIDGRVPEPAPEPVPQPELTTPDSQALTGERNESSVLFSLAMLTKHTEPVAPPSLSPAPLTSLAMSSADDPFTPVLAPPVILHDAEPRRASRAPFAIAAAVLLGFAFVAIALFAAVHSVGYQEAWHVARADRASTPVAIVAPATGSAFVAAPSALATNDTTLAPVAVTPTSVPSSTFRSTTVTRMPIASATPSATMQPAALPSPKCCANESASACEMRRAVGAPCSEETRSFDRSAATQALSAVDVSICKKDASGSGHVKITFDPTGAVTAAAVDASSFSPSVDRCVEQHFRGVHVPAFGGATISVGKSFTIK